MRALLRARNLEDWFQERDHWCRILELNMTSTNAGQLAHYKEAKLLQGQITK